MINAPIRRYIIRRQAGAALVASLVIMLILTLLGVTVMNMTSLEEKMAFNTQDRYVARYLAESAILFVANADNLPLATVPGNSETQAAVDYMDDPIELTSIEIPGLDEAEGRIAYIQDTPYANMPKTNSTSRYFSSGSGDDNAIVFQIHVTATTPAGTTAESKSGFYYVRH
jgi:Tfp pilus assembly protein PilX